MWVKFRQILFLSNFDWPAPDSYDIKALIPDVTLEKYLPFFYFKIFGRIQVCKCFLSFSISVACGPFGRVCTGIISMFLFSYLRK